MNNRSIQYGNRIIFKKETEKSQEAHLKKLREIKESTSKVNQYRSANGGLIKKVTEMRKTNKKKDLLNEMYYTEVERENRILLEKMTKIMRNKSKTLSFDSLNK